MNRIVELGLQPEFQSFILVAVIIYALIFALTERFARTDRARRWVEFVTSVVLILVCVTWGGLNSGREVVLDKTMQFHGICGGAAVRLVDVRSIRGWGEGEVDPMDETTRLKHGDHRVNKGLPNGARIFDRIFEQLHLPHSGAYVMSLTQPQWEEFLRDLRPSDRLQLGRVPFAIVETRSSSGETRREVMFRNDAAVVRNRRGEVESKVCVERVFNIPDTFTEESEAIMLSYGRDECR